ncbi:MAG TPA: hypothetical protein VGN09_08450 [Vicinamibacteria bacterium]|jgi:hypothetical protein
MKKARLTFLKLAVAAAIVTCVSVGSASAQSLKATFTLPYDVQWGKSVLPAGPYTVTFDNLRGPAIVRTSTGAGRAIVVPVTLDKAMKDQPSALLISKIENQRVVRYLNLREADTSFVYRPFTKSERMLVGQLDESEVVPIRMAQK